MRHRNFYSPSIRNEGEPKIRKSYQFRIYPNAGQKLQIAKTFGGCRLVYNRAVTRRKYPQKADTSEDAECPWLKTIDRLAVQYAKQQGEQSAVFQRREETYRAYTTVYRGQNIVLDYEKQRIRLPNLKPIKARLHRTVEGTLQTATVVQLPSDKYYVILSVETEESLAEIQTVQIPQAQTPPNLAKYQQWLERLQQELTQKQKNSANYRKQQKKIAVCKEKIRNIQLDHARKERL